MRFVHLCLALLAAPALAAALPAPPEARVLKEQGDARRKSGDAAGALHAYRAALKLHAGYAEAEAARGEVHYAAKEYRDAIDAFGAAVAIDPGFATAWYNLGFAARKTGDLSRARAAYGRYVELRPADPDGRFGLAETLRALGDREAALREYERCVAMAEAIPVPGPSVEKARAAIAELRAAARPAVGAAPAASGGVTPIAAAAPVAAPAPVAAAAPSTVTPSAWSSTVSPSAAPSTVTPSAWSSTVSPSAAPSTLTPSVASSAVTPSAAPSTLTPSAGSSKVTPSAASSTVTPSAAPSTLTPSVASSAVTRFAEPGSPPAAGFAPAAPSAVVVEKLALGDRAFASGDLRGALFAYQDAVYLEPQRPAARVKLGRAYLALRYTAQAQAQAEQALAVDPASADARTLLDDAKSAPARTATPAAGTPSPGTGRTATAAAPGVTAVPAAAVTGPKVVFAPVADGAARTQARVYRFTPDAAPPPAGAAAPVGELQAERAAPPDVPADPTPAQRYRAALDRISSRDYAAAVAELDQAIAADPRLAVAYAARGSAQFGLARYRESADDYRAALGLDPELGTPLYGLAECYRLLGDSRAADMYRRYSESAARDVREELRTVAARRAVEFAPR